LPKTGTSIFPEEIEAEHTKLCSFLHDNVNNGVYRAGFAASAAIRVACRKLFEALDQLEERLSKSRFFSITASWNPIGDFSAHSSVRRGLSRAFQCNLRRIVDYPNLREYLMVISAAGIAGTVNFDHIKRHYYT
jgi:putative glutathione S-transferase